jgi:hypothetical protein
LSSLEVARIIVKDGDESRQAPAKSRQREKAPAFFAVLPHPAGNRLHQRPPFGKPRIGACRIELTDRESELAKGKGRACTRPVPCLLV